MAEDIRGPIKVTPAYLRVEGARERLPRKPSSERSKSAKKAKKEEKQARKKGHLIDIRV